MYWISLTKNAGLYCDTTGDISLTKVQQILEIEGEKMPKKRLTQKAYEQLARWIKARLLICQLMFCLTVTVNVHASTFDFNYTDVHTLSAELQALPTTEEASNGNSVEVTAQIGSEYLEFAFTHRKDPEFIPASSSHRLNIYTGTVLRQYTELGTVWVAINIVNEETYFLSGHYEIGGKTYNLHFTDEGVQHELVTAPLEPSFIDEVLDLNEFDEPEEEQPLGENVIKTRGISLFIFPRKELISGYTFEDKQKYLTSFIGSKQYKYADLLLLGMEIRLRINVVLYKDIAELKWASNYETMFSNFISKTRYWISQHGSEPLYLQSKITRYAYHTGNELTTKYGIGGVASNNGSYLIFASGLGEVPLIHELGHTLGATHDNFALNTTSTGKTCYTPMYKDAVRDAPNCDEFSDKNTAIIKSHVGHHYPYPEQFYYWDEEITVELTGTALDQGVDYVDMNGDGKGDICYRTVNGFRCDALNHQGQATNIISSEFDPNAIGSPFWGDINDDGTPDHCAINETKKEVVCVLIKYSVGNHIYVSTRFVDQLQSVGDPKGRTFVDFDGDGTRDFCYVEGQYAYCALYKPENRPYRHYGKVLIKSWPLDIGWSNARFWYSVSEDQYTDYCDLQNYTYLFCIFNRGKPTGFSYDTVSGTLDGGWPAGRAMTSIEGKTNYCRIGGSADFYVLCTPIDKKSGFGDTIRTEPLNPGYNEQRHWVDLGFDNKTSFCRVAGILGKDYILCDRIRPDGEIVKYRSASEVTKGRDKSSGWIDTDGNNKQDFVRVAESGNSVYINRTR